ncbi:MAG: hypothetical protein QM500_04165 [Methylococcales bacterium]
MLGWLFGGSGAADKAVDSISSGIDKMFYTDEEKADASQKGFDTFIKWQEATQPQNVARRLIALIITFLFAGLIIAGCAVWPWFPDFSVFIFSMLSELVLPSYIVIIAFYFGKRIISDFKNSG